MCFCLPWSFPLFRGDVWCVQGGARNVIPSIVHNTFLLLQKHLTSGTELILIGWKIVPNESL